MGTSPDFAKSVLYGDSSRCIGNEALLFKNFAPENSQTKGQRLKSE